MGNCAGRYFSRKQQEQIQAMTGMSMTAPAEESGDEEEVEVEANSLPAKAQKAASNVKPDWKGHAAPNTPAAAGREWAANRNRQYEQRLPKGGGKGIKGKGKDKINRAWGQGGIASLDSAAKLHGSLANAYEHGQLARYGDRVLDSKRGPLGPAGSERDAKRLAAARLPKGTPTIAPICPDADEDVADGL